MNPFEALKKLYQQELYQSVAYLGDLLLSTCERRPDSLSASDRYQATIYYADSLMELGHYKKSESMYMKALHLRKNTLSKPPENHKRSTNANFDFISEAEVKFRLFGSLRNQEKYAEAIGALESIPARNRTPKIKLGLATLNRELSKEPQASENYKDLIKDSPYSFDVIIELLTLGTPPEELEEMLARSAGADGFSAMEWFEDWYQAQAAIAVRDYPTAISKLKDLEADSSIANSVQILTDIGRSHYFAGEKNKALLVFQRVHSLDSLCLSGMEILAALYCEDKNMTKELESLATRLMTDSPNSTEAWAAFGYLCRAQKKPEKALYFAQKACSTPKLSARVEGMILKGRILLDMKKWAEATQHFNEALALNPHRIEVYEGLITSFLERDKVTEALRIAKICVTYDKRRSARSLALYATVLAKDEAKLDEARDILERVLKSAPYLLSAVFLLVELYDKLGLYDKAVELLREQTDIHVSNKLHRLLGDFLGKSNRKLEAIDSYRYALSLDPEDKVASESLDMVDVMSETFATPESMVPVRASPAFTHLTNAPRRHADRNSGEDTEPLRLTF